MGSSSAINSGPDLLRSPYHLSLWREGHDTAPADQRHKDRFGSRHQVHGQPEQRRRPHDRADGAAQGMGDRDKGAANKMSWLPWKRDKYLDEQARLERGKLAEAVIRNDRVRNRLTQRVAERPVGDLLNEMFRQLDEGKRRD